MNGRGIVEGLQRMLQERTVRQKELERDIECIEYTLKLVMKEHGVIELPEAPLFEHGLSLTKKRRRALIAWAERNQGILVPKLAKQALIAAELINPGKGAAWIIYGTLSGMECWEKIEPGKYRLIPQEAANTDSLNGHR